LKKERQMNIRVLLAFAAVVSVAVLCAAPASAASIAICNPLFQDPPGPTSWDGVDPTPWDSVPDGQSVTYPTGWVNVNGNNSGKNMVEYNPTASNFTSAAGDTGTLPSPLGIVNLTMGAGGAVASSSNTLYGGALVAPTLGSQALYNISTMDNDCAVLDDAGYTTITLQAHTIYQLTVALGQGLTNSLGYYAGFGFIVADAGYVQNGVVRGFTGAILTPEFHNTGQDVPDPGTFYDYAVTFNSDDYIVAAKGQGPSVGDTIRVGINLGTGSYASDVRVDATPIPEPSTLVLLASGLVGLLAYARRKRT
jgi:hypothetical protein